MQRQLKRCVFPVLPPIRIDGVDAELNEQLSFGLACRLYSSASHVPSQATLRRAIASAKQAEER